MSVTTAVREDLPETTSPTRVLVITESTYPFYWGGLSTWCHALIKELDDISFTLLGISADPFPKVQFDLPSNVGDFRALPLWGIRSAWEVDAQLTRRQAKARSRRTTTAAIEEGFVPLYRELLAQLIGGKRDDAELARALHGLYTFFRGHDFDVTFRSHVVWSVFCEAAEEHYPPVAEALGYVADDVTVAELLAGWHWIYHWLFPLSQPLPETEIAHATMAGTCSLVALVCKLEHGSGFLLSEHGVYLREIFLAEHADQGSLFGKILKLGFARRMTELAYTYADAIAPCCDYNQRWERLVGADQERLWTAYYGIDGDLYRPSDRLPEVAPIVVWAGRIDPLKDVETLLYAAAEVKKERPDVRFLLYGSASLDNRSYLDQCLALHESLGLGDSVSFEGFTSDIVGAFAAGDAVVLSSISEGFPFSTLEAMACGKPVIATAVGGIAEQVTPDCGRVVRPRDPAALAAAIVDVLSDPVRCDVLASAARARAEALFGIDRFVATHRSIYDFVLVSRELGSDALVADIRGGRAAAMLANGHMPQRPAENGNVGTLVAHEQVEVGSESTPTMAEVDA